MDDVISCELRGEEREGEERRKEKDDEKGKRDEKRWRGKAKERNKRKRAIGAALPLIGGRRTTQNQIMFLNPEMRMVRS